MGRGLGLLMRQDEVKLGDVSDICVIDTWLDVHMYGALDSLVLSIVYSTRHFCPLCQLTSHVAVTVYLTTFRGYPQLTYQNID